MITIRRFNINYAVLGQCVGQKRSNKRFEAIHVCVKFTRNAPSPKGTGSYASVQIVAAFILQTTRSSCLILCVDLVIAKQVKSNGTGVELMHVDARGGRFFALG